MRSHFLRAAVVGRVAVGGLIGGMFLGGCAHYEYDVVQPPLQAPRVADKQEIAFEQSPIRYRLRTEDNRLVIRGFNATADVVTLDGSASVLTDPTGQARPVRGQTIPPGAFVRFVLPPVRPEFVSDGGGVGVGLGAGYGPGLGRSEFGFGGDYVDPPTSYRLRDGGEFYWDWPETPAPAALRLVYQTPGGPVVHELRFRRVKVE